MPLNELRPIDIQLVRRTADEPLFQSLMEEHHYLGYEQPVGEHLKYLIWAQGRPVACMAWSSAPRHLGSRDRFIGWSGEARWRNIRWISYNTRFLILPWVAVPHLASHILGHMARRLSEDWEQRYGQPIYFLETFVDPGASDCGPGARPQPERMVPVAAKSSVSPLPGRRSSAASTAAGR